jgi:hypothetical protein
LTSDLISSGVTESIPPAANRHVALVLVAICGIACTMFMSITGVLAGLPAIGAELGGSQRELQWIADLLPVLGADSATRRLRAATV